MATEASKPQTKLTVLKVFKPEEVLGENPPISANFGNQPCPLFTEGQEMIIDG